MAKRRSGSPSSVLRPASPSAAAALPRRPLYPAWSEAENRVADRFARAFISGKYPSIAAASRDCRPALARAGQFKNRTEGGLHCKLRVRVIDMGMSGLKPRWSRGEVRILDRFARAIIRGAYPGAKAAAASCQRALERAGMSARGGVPAVEDKLRRELRALRSHRPP